MSWQTYVDTNLIGGGCCAAAILGLDGTEWASTNLSITPDEGAALVKKFENDGQGFKESGCTLAGKKYFAIQSGGDLFYGKLGPAGCTCAKSGQAITVGLYAEGTAPFVCNEAVEGICKYLKETNY
eukprot:NODE_811_length_690_cov_1284.249610_g741_i0.p1 GENE.NODE_811_length_690_cov_1284.249610_g741_i0~~NODE_811_length_690_cov_1284.249610_g741_i0.p1  ORF type:complete len:126 (-),score=26.99 NODE_811_length_690_cov_1284.249610_g741_i0:217-594(-)